MDIDTVLKELRDLRRQVDSDFQFNALAFKDLAIKQDELGQRISREVEQINRLMRRMSRVITRHTANTAERMNQVEGRMRLQSQRFDRMMEVVEGTLLGVTRCTEQRYHSLEVRVAALEKASNNPPAA